MINNIDDLVSTILNEYQVCNLMLYYDLFNIFFFYNTYLYVCLFIA